MSFPPALQTETPIVPVAIVGSEDQQPGFANLQSVGDLFGMPALPITLGFILVLYIGFASGTRNLFISYLLTFLIGYAFALPPGRRTGPRTLARGDPGRTRGGGSPLPTALSTSGRSRS